MFDRNRTTFAAFHGFQIDKNAFSVGAAPRTPTGETYSAPIMQIPWLDFRGHFRDV